MRRASLHLKILNFLILMMFVVSCVSQPEANKRSSLSKNFFSGGNGSSTGSGSGAGPGTGGIGGDGDEIMSSKVEIRHLVNPIDGTYTRKLTIPKNFTGYLYLSGLNITSLSDRFIKVRFNFGRDREPIDVPAVVAKGPGITPSTDIDVLVLNMNSRPFEQVRLLYDLYDYNEYDFDEKDEDGNFVVEDFESLPVTDNRNKNLYCRGLLSEDDSTFNGPSGSKCDSENQVCLYSYAKVKDRGLQDLDNGVPIIPTVAQIDSENLGYFSSDSQKLLNRCLPDNAKYAQDGSFVGDISVSLTDDLLFDSLGATNEVYGENYMFMGSYLSANVPLWQISSAAAIGAKGVFLDTLSEDTPEYFGNVSLMFPRYIKRNLNANVEHLSSERPNAGKALASLSSPGSTDWMDGCNERITTLNTVTNEHIGSCNVSATIEVWATDPETQNSVLVAGRNDGGVQVKLQLVKPSALNSVGQEVLYSALRSCSSSSACGSEECCYNSRCWSKDIVSQCMEDTSGTGNAQVGASCQTDFDCSSLCCNKTTGRCAVHDNTQSPPVLCNKPAGQMCIAKEWCAKEVVQECFIVKTGTGTTDCGVRCYNRLRHGDCKSGLCVPPIQPVPPVFNPNDPNRCAQAIDPPSE
jgi:hypothetical protein